MGNVPPGVPPAPPLSTGEADSLALRTHYDVGEIMQLHRQFVAEAPTGHIPRTDFTQLADVMGIRDAFLGDLIFNVFDTNRDGFVSFGEFVSAMSVMTRGTPDEKLRFAFRLYDYAGESGRPRGFLERSDLQRVVESLHAMLGGLVSVGGSEFASASQVTDKLFEEMDQDRDGRISLEEYMIGARNDPAIVQGLALV